MTKPRVLISNDDGVAAPGLVALVNELVSDGCVEIVVCGPFGERSAQSHCITIGKHLHAFQISVDGATEAYAVDGTPADSVMMALHGPLLKNPNFDLVVSGINRGDNAGLHVIYSGTVGAAREAACKSLPALAFSLDSHKARSEEQYKDAAKYAVTIIKATLGLLPGMNARSAVVGTFRSHVLNVNIPFIDHTALQGLHICHQGQHCSFPDFQEVDTDPHFHSKNGQTQHYHELHMGEVTLKAFRNAAGFLRGDETPGCDSWALANNWIALTVVGLPSDIPLTKKQALSRVDTGLIEALVTVASESAKHLQVQVAGIPSSSD